MKIAEYKGYSIDFWQNKNEGQFQIVGVRGFFEKFKNATAKIDRVIKAEITKNFPIDAIISSMKIGKITSYNKEEEAVWFSLEDGNRSKEPIVSYSGKSHFYKTNEANLQLVKKYKDISETINKLSDEQRKLEKGLTEPISFETSED